MRRFAAMIAPLVMVCAAGGRVSAQSQPDSVPTETRSAPATITLPAGTKVELAVTGPVWAKTAKPGDPLYSETDFPVAADNHVAIPPGTFVQGRIEGIARPTRRSGRAQIEILFTKIIFADGYVVELPEGTFASPGEGGASAGRANTSEAATAITVNIEVSTSNDLLLDNGAEIEMTLAAPVALDTGQVASAGPLSKAPEPGKFKSATLCRPTPGSPGSAGTPDTVIPGSPGTPDITIPGGPGMPSTTIPGTPATPPTVISGMPGTAGTPGTVCPAPPIVVSSVPLVLKPNQSQAAAPPMPH